MEITDQVIQLHDDRMLGYAEYGDPKGKPLFFFHGWPSSRLQGKVAHKAGQKLKVRIIAIDRPGYGLSTFQKNRFLLDWPNDVAELADTLRIKKFAVMGVSGGGPYAAVCAYKIPQRITKAGIVVGLCPTDVDGVLQGMSFVNKTAWRLYNQFPLLLHISSSLFQSMSKRYFPNIFFFAMKAKPDRKLLSNTSVKEEMFQISKEAFRQGKEGCARDLKLYVKDWGFRIKDIKAKVFLWYGAVDKNVSLTMGKYYASQIKNSQLIIYPNEGHLLIRTHAEEILQALAA